MKITKYWSKLISKEKHLTSTYCFHKQLLFWRKGIHNFCPFCKLQNILPLQPPKKNSKITIMCSQFKIERTKITIQWSNLIDKNLILSNIENRNHSIIKNSQRCNFWAVFQATTKPNNNINTKKINRMIIFFNIYNNNILRGGV